jgi:hypothetical protein
MVYENAQGNTCLSYDRPSSLLQVCAVTDEEFVQTAAELDQKAVFSSTSTTLTIDEGHLASSLSRTTENKGEWKDESYSI